MASVENTTVPHRSRVRVLGDWTEGNSISTNYSIFGGVLAGPEQKDLHAFDYGIGDNAGPGGYGAWVRATKKHTTIERARTLPSGSGEIKGFAILFDGFLNKPISVADTDLAVDDRSGKQLPCRDMFTNFNSLAFSAMQQICAAYQPYLWIDDTEYSLPNMQMMPSDRGLVAASKGAQIMGPVLWMPEGVKLTSQNSFFLGFKLERDLKTHIVNPTGLAAVEEPTISIRLNLGYPVGAQPAVAPGGTVVWTMDFDVIAFGSFDRIVGR